MTTFKTAESPFKADNTASNRCGFTLMNNQVGAIIAEVMSHKDNVTVTPLPSMIRVDAKNRMDVRTELAHDGLGRSRWCHQCEPAACLERSQRGHRLRNRRNIRKVR